MIILRSFIVITVLLIFARICLAEEGSGATVIDDHSSPAPASTGATVVESTSSGSAASASSAFIPASLLLTELLPDPPGKDTENEWVEIWNPGDVPLALDGHVFQSGKAKPVALPTGALAPGGRMVVMTGQEFSLTNNGGILRLIKDAAAIDEVTYPGLPTGVSYRRDGLDDWRAECVPSPGAESSPEPDIRIVLQSGELSATEKTTVNFSMVTSLVSPFTCLWDFGDGTASESCNPASKSYKEPGHYLVQLALTTHCGTTLIREEIVEVHKGQEDVSDVENADPVPPKKSTQPKSSSSSSSTASSSGTVVQAAASVSLTPQPWWSHVRITEIYPRPVKDAPGLLGTEWLEMHNDSVAQIDLHGWTVDDLPGSSKPFTFGTGTVIASDAFIIIPKSISKLSLNDDDETIVLISPDGVTRDQVAFPKMKIGESSARDGDAWCITMPSPSAESQCKPRTSNTSVARAPSTTSGVQSIKPSPRAKPSGGFSVVTTKYRSVVAKSERQEPTPVPVELQAVAKREPSHSPKIAKSQRDFSAFPWAEAVVIGVLFMLSLCVALMPTFPQFEARIRKRQNIDK